MKINDNDKKEGFEKLTDDLKLDSIKIDVARMRALMDSSIRSFSLDINDNTNYVSSMHDRLNRLEKDCQKFYKQVFEKVNSFDSRLIIRTNTFYALIAINVIQFIWWLI